MLGATWAWIIASSYFAYCIFPSHSHELEDIVDTAKPVTAESEQRKKNSSIGSSEIISILPKPFRPSKQLFDQVIYGHPSSGFVTEREEFSKALLNQESQSNAYKSAPSFNNLLILPPETITYKVHENQDYFGDNQELGQGAKLKESDGIITLDTPRTNAEDAPFREDDSLENVTQQKMREFHFHKHKHLHEYDKNPDQRWKSFSDFHSYNHGRRPVHKNRKHRNRHKGIRTNSHHGKLRGHHRNNDGFKTNISKNKNIDYPRKQFDRQQHHRDKVKHLNNHSSSRGQEHYKYRHSHYSKKDPFHAPAKFNTYEEIYSSNDPQEGSEENLKHRYRKRGPDFFRNGAQFHQSQWR